MSPPPLRDRSDRRAQRVENSPIGVMLVGGSAEEAERLRAALAASHCMVFAFSHVPRTSTALTRLETESPDLILAELPASDAGVPQRLAQLRLRAPRIPVVAWAEREDEELAVQVLRMGARGFLTKRESDTRRLVTVLETALSAQRTLLQLQTARERARGLATSDQLTGLANRLLFQDRIVQAVAAARRNRKAVAVLFLDLDGFKLLNDSLGHVAGDGFLRAVAQRLSGCLRESDTAARFGGDEFALLLTGLSGELDAAAVARKVLRAVSTPMVLAQRTFATTASIGIATFPKDGFEPDELLRRADLAMYQAKNCGRNRFAFFTQEMNSALRRRAELESRLRTALEAEQFRVVYQPQFDLRRGRVVGVEALVRWDHPELGLLPPAEFLPTAEASGLIVPIGEWVLRSACQEIGSWQALHSGLRLSVNVASQQFQEPRFARIVADALAKARLSADHLELEITEGTLVRNAGVMAQTLEGLKRVGVSLSIDDFGTGYSALSYLKNLPIDTLKIDRSFIRNLTTDPADATLTETIVRMAQGLNLTTVAEGVETSDQLLLLASFGCQRMQGFLFGKPMPSDALLRSLEEPEIAWVDPVVPEAADPAA